MSVITKIISNKTYLVAGICLIGLIVILFIGFTLGKYKYDNGLTQDYVNKLLQEKSEELNKKLVDEKIKYEQLIKDKDQQISSIEMQLNVSQTKNQSYKKEISKLKVQANTIKTPVNAKEVRERLKVLGYETK